MPAWDTPCGRPERTACGSFIDGLNRLRQQDGLLRRISECAQNIGIMQKYD